MMLPVIRCYHSAASHNPHSFFILSKGEHAGKPALTPWTNSFTVAACNEEMKEFYFWLIYGLYKANCFKVYQRGSVIPFLSVVETRTLIASSAKIIYPHWQQFKAILQQLEQMEQQKTKLEKLLTTTSALQQYLICNFLQQHGLK